MSQRSITCEKSVTFDYPNDGMKIKISRNVYPDDPEDPGFTIFSVNLSGFGDSQAQFSSVKNLERYCKAISYFLDQLDREGGDS
jgi:hypothetical protein